MGRAFKVLISYFAEIYGKPRSKAIKIAFIITTLSVGGAETMLLNLLRRLNSNFRPTVIVLAENDAIGIQIQELGIPVIALNMRRNIPDPAAFFRLIRILHDLHPDIVHTWMYHADLIGGLAARLAGIKAVIWGIRHASLDVDKVKLRTRLIVRVCSFLSHWLPEKILCNSGAAKSFHEGIGYSKNKIFIIPNGFDVARFKPDAVARSELRRDLGVPGEATLVGMIARFDPLKNHLGFINAAALLHRQFPNVHFLMAGREVSPDNPVLTKAIARTGIPGFFHLIGERHDVHRLMASLDVLASPSHGESFPNVLGEAMSCGIPCVTTDAGDSARIVGDTGLVVRGNDFVEFCDGMKITMNMPVSERVELGRRARLRIEGHFEIAGIVRRYEQFYERFHLEKE